MHYLPQGKCANENRKLTHYAEGILSKLIYSVNNEIKPDFVVNLGDLIEDVNNSEDDIKNYKYIYDKLNNFLCPVFSVTGNHDLKTIDSRSTLEKIMGYHHSAYSFDYNNFHFVFLGLDVNNNDILNDGGISRTQYASKSDIEWLESDLIKNKFPCIIFNHFGIAEDNMKGNFWFNNNSENALLKNRKKIKNIINNKNVLGVFSGHQHWTKKIVEDSINYYILGSMTENINNDGIPDGVYFIVEVYKDKLEVTEKHIKI